MQRATGLAIVCASPSDACERPCGSAATEVRARSGILLVENGHRFPPSFRFAANPDRCTGQFVGPSVNGGVNVEVDDLVVLLALAGCSESPTRQEHPVPAAEVERAALSVRAGDVGLPFEGDAYFGRFRKITWCSSPSTGPAWTGARRGHRSGFHATERCVHRWRSARQGPGGPTRLCARQCFSERSAVGFSLSASRSPGKSRCRSRARGRGTGPCTVFHGAPGNGDWSKAYRCGRRSGPLWRVAVEGRERYR